MGLVGLFFSLFSAFKNANIAFEKPAYQISTYKDEFQEKKYIWSASRAVDGILYDKDDRAYAHTNGSASTKEWWMVDLEDVYPITEIYLHGRLVQCTYRLNQKISQIDQMKSFK